MNPPYAADAAPLVVVGDVLLDVDLEGDVSRLCPDEPAPVVESLVERARPGGAGLAAMIAAQRQPVVLVTALGSDAAGQRVREMLDEHVTVVDLGTDRTIVKTRVRSRGRTLIRMDDESIGQPSKPARDVDLDALFSTASAVLVSDYGLGVSGRAAVRWALQDQPRIVWDPHPRGAVPVPGVTTVTPNAAEAQHFSGVPADHVTGAIRQGHELLRRWRAASVTVTRGAAGAVLVNADGTPLVAPAPSIATGDSCGAGDAFAAGLASSLATGRDISEAVCEAVAAAAAYLQRGGVGGMTDPPAEPLPDGQRVVEEVRARGGRVVMAGGCFDLLHAGHISYLEAARALGDCLVVALNSDDSVRALKGQGRPVVTAQDRARVLKALSCVDAVEVFDEPTPHRLLSALRPDIFAKGGDYHSTTIPEADAVRAYGGEVVVLPTLAGRSSTRLVNAARAGARSHSQEEQCRTQPA